MTLRCAVVGATGIAGQQFLSALRGHPDFAITKLSASSRSAGKTYARAITSERGQISWYVDQPLDPAVAKMIVEEAKTMRVDDVDLVFAAVESDAARELESEYAKTVPVVSTASAFRYEDDVPILIPGINAAHVALIERQRQARDWKGFVLPIPNCTTTGLAIALAPLHRDFGIEKVIMTSMQAVSGAGRSPGVISMDIVDNIVPFIPKEEEKVEKETQKILGEMTSDGIRAAKFPISCTCTRVPVLEAHFETVNVALSRAATVDDVKASMRAFGKEIGPSTHPSAPEHWITVSEDPFRPQPRFDRDADGGMTTTVGRIREERVLGEHGVKFCLVSHNTKMGAAKGAVLVAEDLRRRGLI